jgi:hypothetical protein
MTVVAPDYNNFYKLTSNTPGNPAPTKFWRIDANGSLAVVNSANTAEIFNLTDTGALSVGDAAGTRTNLGTVAKAGDTITGNLQVNGALGAGPLVGGSGDLSSVRSASAADGIVFLGNSGSRYLYYNSAAGQYQLNGAHVTSAAGRLWGASDFSAPLQLTGGQMSGNLIAINTANIASGGGVGSFETRGNGTVTNAAMSFHLPGVFAANFGMANDGNFYMGGWSHGAVAYRFYTTRDFNYTPVNKAGDTITGGLTVNGELVAATNYLRFVSSGSAGYIQWNGGNNYGLGGGGTIFHTGNINPIIDGRLAYVADFTYTSGLQEPYGGSVITGGQPTTRQYRHRYMQLQNSAGTWYTVGYV